TSAERAFLDAYVYEATTAPFGGPATTDLRRRGIFYTDLLWILAAYQRELCAEGKIPSGVHNPTPPPSPWENLERASARNQELREELEAASGATTVSLEGSVG